MSEGVQSHEAPAVPPIAVASRARGWWRLVLAVLLALAVPVVAHLRVIVPVEQTVLFIGPAMAVCALAGWMLGGKFWLFAAWGGLAGWMLSVRIPDAGAFDPLSRGWVLLVAAAFGLFGIEVVVDRAAEIDPADNHAAILIGQFMSLAGLHGIEWRHDAALEGDKRRTSARQVACVVALGAGHEFLGETVRAFAE